MRRRVKFIGSLPDFSKTRPNIDIVNNNICRRYWEAVLHRKERTTPDYKLVCVCVGNHLYRPCAGINLFQNDGRILYVYK